MLQAKYRTEGMQHFMCLSCKEMEAKNYENNLLQYMSIPYLLPYEIRELNSECEIYYRLKYRTTVKDVLGHLQLDLNRVKQIVNSIVKVLEVIDNYMLSVDKVLWKTGYIFIEADTGNLQFCYYPDYSVCSANNCDLVELITEILQVIDRKEEDALLYMLEFYNYITNPDFDIRNINQFLGEEERDSKEVDYISTVNKNDDLQSEECKQEKKTKLWKHSEKRFRKVKKSEDDTNVNGIQKICKVFILGLSVVNVIGIALLLFDLLPYSYVGILIGSMIALILATIVYMNFSKEETPDEMMQSFFEEMNQAPKVEADTVSETNIKVQENMENTVEQGKNTYGETTLLTNYDKEQKKELVVEDKKGPYILASFHKDQYPEITILSNIVIGRMRAGCNYILKEKDVSRMHAKICYKTNGEIYLMDMNSRNGTFLNGERIAAGEEILLTEGDALSFANCEFYLRR